MRILQFKRGSSMSKFLQRAGLVAFCLTLFGALSTCAQDNARLGGTVKDPSGATVAGASVTLTNEATNVSVNTKTDNDGNYLYPLVAAASYRLTVEKNGFKKSVQNGIKLEVNQNGRIDVVLEVGQTSETIEVSAAVPQVD